jgi:hypothetical protein
MAASPNEPRDLKIVSLEDAIRDVKIAAADRGDVERDDGGGLGPLGASRQKKMQGRAMVGDALSCIAAQGH